MAAGDFTRLFFELQQLSSRFSQLTSRLETLLASSNIPEALRFLRRTLMTIPDSGNDYTTVRWLILELEGFHKPPPSAERAERKPAAQLTLQSMNGLDGVCRPRFSSAVEVEEADIDGEGCESMARDAYDEWMQTETTSASESTKLDVDGSVRERGDFDRGVDLEPEGLAEPAQQEDIWVRDSVRDSQFLHFPPHQRGDGVTTGSLADLFKFQQQMGELLEEKKRRELEIASIQAKIRKILLQLFHFHSQQRGDGVNTGNSFLAVLLNILGLEASDEAKLDYIETLLKELEACEYPMDEVDAAIALLSDMDSAMCGWRARMAVLQYVITAQKALLVSYADAALLPSDGRDQDVVAIEVACAQRRYKAAGAFHASVIELTEFDSPFDVFSDFGSWVERDVTSVLNAYMARSRLLERPVCFSECRVKLGNSVSSKRCSDVIARILAGAYRYNRTLCYQPKKEYCTSEFINFIAALQSHYFAAFVIYTLNVCTGLIYRWLWKKIEEIIREIAILEAEKCADPYVLTGSEKVRKSLSKKCSKVKEKSTVQRRKRYRSN